MEYIAFILFITTFTIILYIVLKYRISKDRVQDRIFNLKCYISDNNTELYDKLKHFQSFVDKMDYDKSLRTICKMWYKITNGSESGSGEDWEKAIELITDQFIALAENNANSSVWAQNILNLFFQQGDKEPISWADKILNHNFVRGFKETK